MEFRRRPKEDEVILYIADVLKMVGIDQAEDDVSVEALEKRCGGIAPRYLEKAEKTKERTAKLQELAVGMLLAEVLDVHRNEDLYLSEFGKPALCDGPEFSISHAGPYVVLAVSEEPVGVDIENGFQVPLVALKRVAGGKAASECVGLSEDSVEYAHRAGEIWTRVEAMLKAAGTGFHGDPRKQPELLQGWFVRTMVPSAGYVISCARRSPFNLSTFVELP